MQLYEVLCSLCRFPTKSVLAPKYPSTPLRGKYWNTAGNGCMCEWGFRLKLFNKCISKVTIGEWEFLWNTCHIQHLNEMKIYSTGTWVTSHFITVIHYPAIFPQCWGGGSCVDDWRLCAWGCALPPVNGPVTLMWVSVCCSFWILSWTLLSSLDKQLPPFCESSSEPRTRAASLTSPDWSSTWKHTFMNLSSHSVNLLKANFLTICKISADPLSACREKRAKLTKRLMISKIDNDCCCSCGDSRVITDCKEPTGRGGFKAVNRARRWSNASLACTWKHTRQIKGAVNCQAAPEWLL